METPKLTTFILLLFSIINTSFASKNPSSAAKFVKTSCLKTIHPDTCEENLLPYADKINKKPIKLAHMALIVSRNKANASKIFMTNLRRHYLMKHRSYNDHTKTLQSPLKSYEYPTKTLQPQRKPSKYPTCLTKTLRKPYQIPINPTKPLQRPDNNLTKTLQTIRKPYKNPEKTLQNLEKTNKPYIDAANDCLSQLGEGDERIRDSVKELERAVGGEFVQRIGNVKTWVSAALTEADSCIDEFFEKGINVIVRNLVQRNVTVFANATSDALAFVNLVINKNT